MCFSNSIIRREQEEGVKRKGKKEKKGKRMQRVGGGDRKGKIKGR